MTSVCSVRLSENAASSVEGIRGRGLPSVGTSGMVTSAIRDVRERAVVALLTARLSIFLVESILFRPGEKVSESPDELEGVGGGEDGKDGESLTVT